MTEDKYKHSQEGPCVICGGQDYTWGRLSGQYELAFKEGGPYRPGLLAGLLGQLPSEFHRARCCNACGNVQLFVRRIEFD